MDSESKSAIEYFCPQCGGGISCPAEEAGRDVECPACGAVHTVPGPEEEMADLHSEPEEMVKFFCPHCDQKLSSPVGLAGHSFDCPNCGASNIVPGERAAPAPAPVDEALVKFFCSHCGQRLACDPEAAGKMIDCPVCAEPTAVPGPLGADAAAMTPRTVSLVPKPAAKMTPPPKMALPSLAPQGSELAVPEPASAGLPRPVAKPTARITPPPVGGKPAGEPEPARELAETLPPASPEPSPDPEKEVRAQKTTTKKSGGTATKVVAKKAAAKKAAAKKVAGRKAPAKKRPAGKKAKENVTRAAAEKPAGALRQGEPRPQRPLTKAEEMSEAREALKEALRKEARIEADRPRNQSAAPPGFPLRPTVPMQSRSGSGPAPTTIDENPPPGAGSVAPAAPSDPVVPKPQTRVPGVTSVTAGAVLEKTVWMKKTHSPGQEPLRQSFRMPSAGHGAESADPQVEPLRLTDPASGANRTILPPPRQAPRLRAQPALEEDFELSDAEPVRLTELVSPVTGGGFLPWRGGSDLSRRVAEAMADDPGPDPFEEGLGGDGSAAPGEARNPGGDLDRR